MRYIFAIAFFLIISASTQAAEAPVSAPAPPQPQAPAEENSEDDEGFNLDEVLDEDKGQAD